MYPTRVKLLHIRVVSVLEDILSFDTDDKTTSLLSRPSVRDCVEASFALCCYLISGKERELRPDVMRGLVMDSRGKDQRRIVIQKLYYY